MTEVLREAYRLQVYVCSEDVSLGNVGLCLIALHAACTMSVEQGNIESTRHDRARTLKGRSWLVFTPHIQST